MKRRRSSAALQNAGAGIAFGISSHVLECARRSERFSMVVPQHIWQPERLPYNLDPDS